MRRFFSFAAAATLLATSALAQTTPTIHKATIGDVKVSGVSATSANTAPSASSFDSRTNLLRNFTDVEPAIPVLPPPSGAAPGHTTDCVGPHC